MIQEARGKVSYAVKRGDLRRITECSCIDCNKPAVFYNHDDYNKPLGVVPLCQRCDYIRHHGIILNKLKVIGAMVSPSFKRTIKIEAAKRNLTVNDFIIAAIRYYIKETTTIPIIDENDKDYME